MFTPIHRNPWEINQNNSSIVYTVQEKSSTKRRMGKHEVNIRLLSSLLRVLVYAVLCTGGLRGMGDFVEWAVIQGDDQGIFVCHHTRCMMRSRFHSETRRARPPCVLLLHLRLLQRRLVQSEPSQSKGNPSQCASLGIQQIFDASKFLRRKVLVRTTVFGTTFLSIIGEAYTDFPVCSSSQPSEYIIYLTSAP